MNKTTLSFNASEQLLTSAECPKKVASNTVSYIEAVFELGANWSGFDSVRAVWSTRLEKISTVLDSNGKCIVPHELLANTQKVSVNLVGSIVEDDVLTDRLTTYPIVALDVDADALVEGTETTEVTPSQFEQFVHTVIDEVAKIKDIESVELNDDYTLTIRFSDDTETTVGPIRGEKGDTGPTGNGIAGIVKTSTTDLVDTYTITYTNGQTTTFNVTNGAKGDTGATGNGIATIAKTSTSGLVDTYTITFTDGTSTTFEVTNGQDGEVTYDELSELLPTEIASGDIASFNDGQAVIPAVSVVATITPIQSGSGTPSPSNVRPISGHDDVDVVHTGKNLFDIGELVALGTGIVEVTNGYRFSATSAMYNTGVTLQKQLPNPVTISMEVANITGSNLRVRVVHTDGTENEPTGSGTGAGGHVVLHTTKPIKGIKFNWSSAGTFEVTNFQMEFGEIETTYEPYTSTTYTTTLPSTTYGGTLDLVSGVLVDDLYYVADIADFTWTTRATGSVNKTLSVSMGTGYYPVSSVQVFAEKFGYNGSVAGAFALSNPDSKEVGLYTYNSGTYDDSLYCVLPIGDTPSGAMCYTKFTPQTYQLTPQQIQTLVGQNNITATSGQVSVTYKADIQKYIDNAIATFA